MSDAGLREQIEKQNGGPIRDETWDAMVRLGETRNVQPVDIPELAGRARVIDRLWSEAYRAGRRAAGEAPSTAATEPPFSVPVAPPEPGDYVRRRSRAFSDAVARLIAERGAVREFRAQVLGGRTLTPEEAHRFAESPANRMLSRATLELHGVPLVGHVARVDREGLRPDPAGLTFERVSVFVDPPGATIPGHHRAAGPDRLYHRLDFPARADRPEDVHGIDVWSGSVLDELREVACGVSESAPWSAAEVAWFVLTGGAPEVRPISLAAGLYQAHDHWRATLTLTVEPWVDSATVARAYRAAQASIFGHRSREMSRGLDVWLFVREQERRDGHRPPWRTLYGRWLAGDPGARRFKGGWRQFRIEYVRAEQALLFPNYRPLEGEPRKRTPEVRMMRPRW